jgi:hypothetical protein
VGKSGGLWGRLYRTMGRSFSLVRRGNRGWEMVGKYNLSMVWRGVIMRVCCFKGNISLVSV